MKIILIDRKENLEDMDSRFYRDYSDCACDCDCACPTEGILTPPLSLPIAYYLELTPVCNNLCPGCGNIYSSDRKSRNALNGKGWSSLIKQLALHAHHFKLTGGEATLHKDFSSIVQEIENAGITFTLFTNARWTKPNELISLLKSIHTFDGMLVSLHGPNAIVHDSFSGIVGSFQETAQNIRLAARQNIKFATSFVINSQNWNSVEETLGLALELGASSMVCNRLIGTPIPGITPTENEVRHAMQTIEHLRKSGSPIRFGNCIPQCFEPSSSTGCSAGITFATIDPWGMVRPCNHAPIIAGDSAKYTIKQIWSGPMMNYWRSMISSECQSCSSFSTCHGGCRAQALLEGQVSDSLIRERLVESPSLFNEELYLYSGLRPVGRFVNRSEEYGDILIHKSQAMMIPPTDKKVLTNLNGDLTLAEIKQKHGDKTLDTIGLLYEKGMITWATAAP